MVKAEVTKTSLHFSLNTDLIPKIEKESSILLLSVVCSETSLAPTFAVPLI